jgi:hypothetical protein
VRLSELRFLAAALVLHLALPVAAAIVPARDELAALTDPVTEIEVDVAEASPPVIDERPPPLATDVEPADVEQPVDARTRRMHVAPYLAPTASAERKRAEVDSPPIRTPRTKPGSNEYDLPPGAIPGPGQIPGAGGPSVWQVLPGSAPTARAQGPAAPTATPRRKVDQEAGKRAIEAAVRAKDRKLGLDFPAASAIASVVRRTVRGSEAPYTCLAGFSIALGPQGTTRSVSLIHHQGGTASLWNSITSQVQSALGTRAFPMRSGFEKGAIVSVTVRSMKRKPAGGASRKGLGISFDPSNIGARETRLVSVGFSAEPVQ